MGRIRAPDATLSHYLSREAGQPGRFLNCGINGLFPLALEGLVDDYGRTLRDRQVIVHCNLLWMTSPKADLSTEKEESFNHSSLVPQFRPRLPCYRADVDTRLSAVVGRKVGFFSWIEHVQDVYFGAQEHSPLDPGTRPEPAAALPQRLAQSAFLHHARGARRTARRSGARPGQPAAQALDQRRRLAQALRVGRARQSLQWQAFQRVVARLRQRGCDVLVIIGPFNEPMVAPEQRPLYHQLRDGIAGWLRDNQVACVAAETLPSELYADASHPLSEGYALLARQITSDSVFQQWLAKGREP